MSPSTLVTFNEYYDNIQPREKKLFLLEYMKESEQSIGTFYNKKKKDAFTKLERDLLERLANQKFNWNK